MLATWFYQHWAYYIGKKIEYRKTRFLKDDGASSFFLRSLRTT
jgi:hypothetical protein